MSCSALGHRMYPETESLGRSPLLTLLRRRDERPCPFRRLRPMGSLVWIVRPRGFGCGPSGRAGGGLPDRRPRGTLLSDLLDSGTAALWLATLRWAVSADTEYSVRWTLGPCRDGRGKCPICPHVNSSDIKGGHGPLPSASSPDPALRSLRPNRGFLLAGITIGKPCRYRPLGRRV